MIKEKNKSSKYNYEKTKSQVIKEYLRTFFVSVIISAIITGTLAIHARNEMIKDISRSNDLKQSMDKKLAQQLIQNSDLMDEISSKSASVCMHIGDLYETAGDYVNAQIAYEESIRKAKPNSYNLYYKLICVLTAQNKMKDSEAILDNIKDRTDKNLIKFKTRSYIVIGDKYYSNGKFLSAAKSYEKAFSYYNRFSKKDRVIEESIKYRIVNSYINVADIMVNSSRNSDAVRYLKKAESFIPNDYNIRYKLAIILSDSDPEEAVKYIKPLLKERPQDFDYSVYSNAFLKAANIADLDGRTTQAKNYRYKVHSIDMFIKNKVVYKNDIEIDLLTFTSKKKLFTYPLGATYAFTNVSNSEIPYLYADFVLMSGDKVLEKITKPVSDKESPLYTYAEQPNVIAIKFKKKIFTKKELENYVIDVYLYKDKKYKTHALSMHIPLSR